jgi:Bacterial protein of unknown function (DUF922)
MIMPFVHASSSSAKIQPRLRPEVGLNDPCVSEVTHEAAERQPALPRPSATAVEPVGRATTVLALQQAIGNAGVTRILRQHTPPPPTTGSAGATVGRVGGRRPAVRATTQNFADCNAAVDWLNSGADAGDASPQYHPTAGRIRHSSQPDGTVTAEVDLSWAYDPSSRAEMIIPTWPHMTATERTAVARYRAAIQAHEVKHFDVTDNVVRALPRTVSATGATQAEAMSNLQAAVTKYGADAQTAIDAATQSYDDTTHHGRTQSAVGGVDVHLDCGGGSSP